MEDGLHFLENLEDVFLLSPGAQLGDGNLLAEDVVLLLFGRISVKVGEVLIKDGLESQLGIVKKLIQLIVWFHKVLGESAFLFLLDLLVPDSDGLLDSVGDAKSLVESLPQRSNLKC